MLLSPLSRRAGCLVARSCSLRRGLRLYSPKVSTKRFVDRYHYRQYISPSEPLLNLESPPTDESVIESNKDYLIKTLGFCEEHFEILQTKGTNIIKLESGVLEGRVNWLKERLGLDQDGITRFAQKYPSILGYSITDQMEPMLAWLQKRLALDDAALSKIIQKSWSTLGNSITNELEPKFNWLQQRLSLVDADLSNVVQRYPHIMWLSVDKLEPLMDWVQQRLSLTDDELSIVVKRFPSVVGYSVENNLEPTLNFYVDALGDEGEALALIKQNPSFFGRSLENRLKPRLKEAREAGLVIDAKCLKSVAYHPEKKWDAFVTSQAAKS